MGVSGNKTSVEWQITVVYVDFDYLRFNMIAGGLAQFANCHSVAFRSCQAQTFKAMLAILLFLHSTFIHV